MEGPDRWVAHGEMSDPGRHAASIAVLPADVGALNEIIQGVLVHSDWAKEYGLDAATPRRRDAATPGAPARRTMPIAERLDDILNRDPRAFEARRPPDKRSTGTCRDFALALCSFLRSRQVTARLRCGFAAYFDAEWEDHWVCEYWDAKAGTWRLSDAQIDPMLRRRNGIEFDPADVPRQLFKPAGEAWLSCRRAQADPDAFGHGDAKGWWFLKVNVVRDHYVLNGRVTSLWDRWREASSRQRSVRGAEMELLDNLATSPEQLLIELAADWLERPEPETR
ncbi:transglutaminase domain-containing protein [Mesorhizobium sp. B2-3-4]|uniref:transglutaminase domain-containing protein n=1 Tax=Mesorhizobium sp. B2-3-4 TaxID=2589959 RepID=UPI00112C32B6|nr:transglutaminase domain-containing protein [Mesorhizobium sp. B2-3-4]TPM37506.1 transglutaminase [Mesorhizobium sp. B2-3-4]